MQPPAPIWLPSLRTVAKKKCQLAGTPGSHSIQQIISCKLLLKTEIRAGLRKFTASIICWFSAAWAHLRAGCSPACGRFGDRGALIGWRLSLCFSALVKSACGQEERHRVPCPASPEAPGVGGDRSDSSAISSVSSGGASSVLGPPNAEGASSSEARGGPGVRTQLRMWDIRAQVVSAGAGSVVEVRSAHPGHKTWREGQAGARAWAWDVGLQGSWGLGHEVAAGSHPWQTLMPLTHCPWRPPGRGPWPMNLLVSVTFPPLVTAKADAHSLAGVSCSLHSPRALSPACSLCSWFLVPEQQ